MNRRDLRRQLIDAIAGGDLPRVAEIATSAPSIVNAPNTHQNVPLDDAIATGRLDLVELSIADGSDPHHCNHGGHSMLDEAAFFRSREDCSLADFARRGTFRASRRDNRRDLTLGTDGDRGSNRIAAGHSRSRVRAGIF